MACVLSADKIVALSVIVFGALSVVVFGALFADMSGILRPFLCSGDHTETTDIEFDPQQTSYEALLKIFWRNHDPTSRCSRQVSRPPVAP